MKKLIKFLLLLILIILIVGLIYLFVSNNDNKKSIGKSKKNIILTRDDKINNIIENMNIDEKIYQLFYVQIQESNWSNYNNVKYGGVIIGSKSSYDGLDSIGKDYKILPFIGTDDEGGYIERAATGYRNARDYNANTKLIYDDEVKKSKELLTKNINMNLGPVSDSISSTNSPLYYRSYSSNRDKTKECISTIIKARNDTVVNSKKIGSVLKHYPGYPEIGINTDYAEALDNTSIDEINKNISVFDYGIENGTNAIMVSNVIYKNLDKDNPASLSSKIIGPLRAKFDGLIIPDDIGVAKGLINIEDRYVKALVVGNDMIVLWNINVEDAYQNIKDNIDKQITEAEIDKKLYRIINTKYDLGIIKE